MRCVRIQKPGSYQRLELVEAAEPIPDRGQVQVNVRAAGVNFADCVVRMGLYESAKKYVGWPITPGFELAGTVERIGSAVSGFTPGDRVFGLSRFGAYASQVVVNEGQLYRIPAAWSFEQAAAFPVAFLTAWYALTELCRLRPGARVLVHSAAGGVGGAAIQIARSLGAEVIGVVGSSHKLSVARALGCTQVIDKSQTPLWRELERLYPDGVDVVLDPNGPETLRQGFAHLRPTGRLIIYGFQTMLVRGRGLPSWPKLLWSYLRLPRFNPLRMTNENKSVLAFNLSYLFEQRDRLDEAMSALLVAVTAGTLTPLSCQSFPFEQVADAHRALESGTTTGKLVLTL